MTKLESFLFIKYTLPIAVVLLILTILAILGGSVFLITFFRNRKEKKNRKDNKSGD